MPRAILLAWTACLLAIPSVGQSQSSPGNRADNLWVTNAPPAPQQVAPIDIDFEGHGRYSFGDPIPDPWYGVPLELAQESPCLMSEMPNYGEIPVELSHVCYIDNQVATIILYVESGRYDSLVAAAAEKWGPPRFADGAVHVPILQWADEEVSLGIYQHRTILGPRTAIHFDNIQLHRASLQTKEAAEGALAAAEEAERAESEARMRAAIEHFPSNLAEFRGFAGMVFGAIPADPATAERMKTTPECSSISDATLSGFWAELGIDRVGMCWFHGGLGVLVLTVRDDDAAELLRGLFETRYGPPMREDRSIGGRLQAWKAKGAVSRWASGDVALEFGRKYCRGEWTSFPSYSPAFFFSYSPIVDGHAADAEAVEAARKHQRLQEARDAL